MASKVLVLGNWNFILYLAYGKLMWNVDVIYQCDKYSHMIGGDRDWYHTSTLRHRHPTWWRCSTVGVSPRPVPICRMFLWPSVTRIYFVSPWVLHCTVMQVNVDFWWDSLYNNVKLISYLLRDKRVLVSMSLNVWMTSHHLTTGNRSWKPVLKEISGQKRQ